MSELKFLIVGAGGHARSIIEALRSTGSEIEGILDTDYKGQDESIMGVKVLGALDELLGDYANDNINIALALGNAEERRREFDRLSGLGYALPTIVHSSALLTESAVVGKGVFIAPGAIIGALATIRDNSIINTGAIVDHETSIGPHSHICPGVSIAGRVSIGEASFIGIGSSIIDGISVGENSIVGAGSVVIEDVAAGVTVTGTPARVVK